MWNSFKDSAANIKQMASTPGRERDETGHRTGLGTLAKSFAAHPIDTTKAVGAFASSYSEMRNANVRGGNLAAHEKANYEATKIMGGNTNVAAALSAVREKSKEFRTPQSTSNAAVKGYGDMRTHKEIKATMDANKAGRDRAVNESMKKKPW